MFTAMKLAGLAAVAALAGGLLFAIPGTPGPESGPPAAPASGSGMVTPVSGTSTAVAWGSGGTVEPGALGGEGIAYLGVLLMSENVTDDPRLDGNLITRINQYSLQGGDTMSQTVYLGNEGGSWVGSGYCYVEPVTRGMHCWNVLQGQGGYEGLTAVLDSDRQRALGAVDLTGAIILGDLPPMPDPAPTTLTVAGGEG